MKSTIFFHMCLFLIFVSLLNNVASQSTAPCRSDWDCRSLEYFVKLDKNLCIGDRKFYDMRTDPLLPWAPSAIQDLIGKRYTMYIQVGYIVPYVCNITKGICEMGQIKIFDESLIGKTYFGCKYGCLDTPVEKSGKVWSNFCVCMPGQGRTFCDPEKSRHIYYEQHLWNCEKEIDIATRCAIGSQCGRTPTGGFTCTEIKGIDPMKSDDPRLYNLIVPENLSSGPIKVAIIKNNQIIAEKPISELSALEYISKYGPLDSSQAYAFAQQTGLTSIAENSANYGSISTSTSSMGNTANVSSSSSSSGSSWLSKIASFFGFGRKSTNTASSTASQYANTYSTSYSTTSSYANTYSATSTYSSYPRTYSAYTTNYSNYATSYTGNYGYSAYSTTYPTYYSSYSAPSYSATTYSTYSPYKTYSYPSYNYSNYASTYSNYSYPSYSYSYSNYSNPYLKYSYNSYSYPS
ncbi:MAG: hypothetical protein N3F05_02470 [Candidatus Diapherotrites archaeon]|nr:hypothetical protein [Candidatus Diapherotrites archaeon]